ncbi:MAG: ABC transporter substrate-binding protein [Saprospiraceae bacterium]
MRSIPGHISPWLVLAVFAIGLCFASSCKKSAEKASDTTLNIRIAAEPDRINPMLSKSPVASQIEQLIYYKLLDFDRVTLELIPMLAKRMPTVTLIDTGIYRGFTAYDFEIRVEANWDNGSPITGNDLLFSIKLAMHPEVPAGSWKNFLEYIPQVEVDQNNQKKLRIYLNKSYLLADVIAGNFEIYPEYLLDPKGILKGISYQDLNDAAKLKKLSADSSFIQFGQEFAKSGTEASTMLGSGPYKLDNWTPGKELILSRKSDWWGDKISEKEKNSFFTANPSRIKYVLIADELAALTALRNKQIDLCNDIEAKEFQALQTSAEDKNTFNCFTAKLMQFFFVGIHMQKPGLNDLHVRKALAYAMPVDKIIQQLFGGYAERIVGPIHPSKHYYNKALKPIPFDLGLAKKELNDGGWADTDGNGIADKQIDGKKVELSFNLLTTNKKLGQELALIFKQEAKNIGIEINIEAIEAQSFQKRLRARDFDLVNFAIKQYPGYVDLEPSWHSKSIGEKGNNISGFGDASSDAIIDSLNLATDTKEIYRLYREIQEKIYADQAAIFLCSPLERIALNKKWRGEGSDRAPGYFEQLFTER